MKVFLFFILTNIVFLHADSVDWSENARVQDPFQRANVYGLSAQKLLEKKKKGLGHALLWPIPVTGLLLPFKPVERFFSSNMFFNVLASELLAALTPYDSVESFYSWLGLNDFPEKNAPSWKDSFPKGLLRPKGQSLIQKIGVAEIQTQHGKALTFSCLSCHASNLFGRTVVGLPNKVGRSEEFFATLKRFEPLISADRFQSVTGSSSAETKIFRKTLENLKSIRTRAPRVLGLDTALSHTGLSLTNRNDDAWATKSSFYEKNPRFHQLDRLPPIESKIGTWWTVKYKNKFLSDGSMVSGNPILTNFIWNEIGRGTDLNELSAWIDQNPATIQELTTLVFSSVAPSWGEFFPKKKINLTSAQRGEVLFQKNCQSCHGRYEKNWNRGTQTLRVDYPENTKIKDVGTDPLRRIGMRDLSKDLNKLALSKKWGIRLQEQKGYVPPPLEGIWSRYPYLHNGSIPNLCELLTPAKKRISVFFRGPAERKDTDFDSSCVGYPTGLDVPLAWEFLAKARHDTRVYGLQNIGHDEMLFDERGRELFSRRDKLDLIEFMKSL